MKIIFKKLFYLSFIIIFTLTFIKVFTGSNIEKYNTIAVLILICLWAIIIFFIIYFISSKNNYFFKSEKLTLFYILGLLFSVQIALGFLLETRPIFDFGAVYDGAITWLKEGTLSDYDAYFYKYPNNQGALILLRIVFGIADKFSINYFYAVGIFLNALIIDFSFLLVYFICKNMFGRRTAMFSLALCLLCIPMYFYVPIFYTDILSMVFIPLTYYLYIKSKDASGKKKIIFFMLMGAASAVGFKIKGTVIIVLIAIFIDILLSYDVKKYLFPAISAIAVFIMVCSIFNIYIYSTVLNKNMEDRYKYPYTHWIMMGLEDNGMYNGSLSDFTASFDNEKSRDEAAREKISSQLENHGLLGYIDFLYNKGAINFGAGDFRVQDFLDDNPVNQTIFHEIALYDGKHFGLFKHITQGYHILLFILIIYSAYIQYKYFNINKPIVVSFLSIFGIFIFLLFWEANPRYITNFFPMFTIAAASVMHNININSQRCLKNINLQEASSAAEFPIQPQKYHRGS